MDFLSRLAHPELILYSLPGILLGLVFHELAHAFVADRLGDPTPRMMGRLTLNPFPHIDPIGFVMLILVGFGWAKPVVTNPTRYRTKRFGFALVALAGPVMNLLLGTVLLFIYLFLLTRGILPGEHAIMMILASAAGINYVLMVFNLIPIPPLDGYNILKDFLLVKYVRSQSLWKFEQYGRFVLLALIFLGATSRIIGTVYEFLINRGYDLFILIFGSR